MNIVYKLYIIILEGFQGTRVAERQILIFILRLSYWLSWAIRRAVILIFDQKTTTTTKSTLFPIFHEKDTTRHISDRPLSFTSGKQRSTCFLMMS